MRKFLRLLAASSAALCLAGPSAAGIITFDALDATGAPFFPLIGNGDFVEEGAYRITVGSLDQGVPSGDLVGAIVDGSNPFMCDGLICPANNDTQYLAALNGGLPFIDRVDAGLFQLTQ